MLNKDVPAQKQEAGVGVESHCLYLSLSSALVTHTPCARCHVLGCRWVVRWQEEQLFRAATQLPTCLDGSLALSHLLGAPSAFNGAHFLGPSHSLKRHPRRPTTLHRGHGLRLRLKQKYDVGQIG